MAAVAVLEIMMNCASTDHFMLNPYGTAGLPEGRRQVKGTLNSRDDVLWGLLRNTDHHELAIFLWSIKALRRMWWVMNI